MIMFMTTVNGNGKDIQKNRRKENYGMNNMIKTVGLYVLGATVGGFVGLKIAEFALREEYEEIVSGENDPDEMFEDATTAVAAINCTEETPEEEEPKVKTKKPKKAAPVVDYTSYQTPAKKAKLEDLAEKYRTPEDGPRVISLDEYVDGDNANGKVNLSYYTEDNVLCTQDEEIVENREDVIGVEALKHFGDMSEDPEIVYVRNNKQGTDYEVIRVKGSYKKLVAGIMDDEEIQEVIQKIPRKKKGRKEDEERD